MNTMKEEKNLNDAFPNLLDFTVHTSKSLNANVPLLYINLNKIIYGPIFVLPVILSKAIQR